MVASMEITDRDTPMYPMIERDRATPEGRLSGRALRRMAKLVRCVHSHTVCVELESLSFLTHPSVFHRPLARGFSLLHMWKP